MPGSEAVTDLLIAWRRGDEEALGALMPLVYDRLHRLATSFLRHERRGHTLQATALVHEAFLRLIRQNRVDWRDRAHFFAISGKLMRRILVDHARHGSYAKRGGGAIRVGVEILADVAVEKPEELLALDEALEALAARDGELGRLVELRYFAGLEIEEAAEVLAVSRATVIRRWRLARAWLHHFLTTGVELALEKPSGHNAVRS